SYLTWASAALIVVGFSTLSLIHRKISQPHPPLWINKLYIHAINGFYFEAIFKQYFKYPTR
ncbi:MAG: hypothetical protein KDA74_10770, partial [Planctomycetaceae bacterium]|nr:hypothetical protein [Planctomycetaceae bacterium]